MVESHNFEVRVVGAHGRPQMLAHESSLERRVVPGETRRKSRGGRRRRRRGSRVVAINESNEMIKQWKWMKGGVYDSLAGLPRGGKLGFVLDRDPPHGESLGLVRGHPFAQVLGPRSLVLVTRIQTCEGAKEQKEQKEQ